VLTGSTCYRYVIPFGGDFTVTCRVKVSWNEEDLDFLPCFTLGVCDDGAGKFFFGGVYGEYGVSMKPKTQFLHQKIETRFDAPQDLELKRKDGAFRFNKQSTSARGWVLPSNGELFVGAHTSAPVLLQRLTLRVELDDVSRKKIQSKWIESQLKRLFDDG
jgi:hypothetical protein